MLASSAGTADTMCMQYTIRGIPERLDTVLRERARAENKSLNEIALGALADGLGVGSQPTVRRDLGDVAGTWKKDAEAEAVFTPSSSSPSCAPALRSAGARPKTRRSSADFSRRKASAFFTPTTGRPGTTPPFYRQLKRQGAPIPTHDLWIAALVLRHDLVLHSRDRHFDQLPQISRV